MICSLDATSLLRLNRQYFNDLRGLWIEANLATAEQDSYLLPIYETKVRSGDCICQEPDVKGHFAGVVELTADCGRVQIPQSYFAL
jgi:hypothetical protein